MSRPARTFRYKRLSALFAGLAIIAVAALAVTAVRPDETASRSVETAGSSQAEVAGASTPKTVAPKQPATADKPASAGLAIADDTGTDYSLSAHDAGFYLGDTPVRSAFAGGFTGGWSAPASRPVAAVAVAPAAIPSSTPAPQPAPPVTASPAPTPVPATIPDPVTQPDPGTDTQTGTAFTRPLVSLTFDDGWQSIHDNGLPLLGTYGFVSTQYVNSQPIDESFVGYMKHGDVRDFAAKGHEIAWHTRSHADLTAPGTDVDTELTVPQPFIDNLVNVNVTRNFATPFGAYNDDVLGSIRQHGFTSHRSVDAGYNTKSGFDAYNIKVQNMLNTTTVAELQGWLDQAAASNAWLVLVYHEVSDSPVDPDPTYSTTISNFDQQLGLIKQSGVEVRTVEGALAELLPQL